MKAKLYFIDIVPRPKVINMKGFRVVGSFKDVRQGKQPYTVEVAADSEDAAKEQVLSTLGSRHKLKRWEINIDAVTELANEDIVDPVVKYKVTGE